MLEVLEGIAQVNNEWGIDHGAWSLLIHLFLKEDVPVVMLSVDGLANGQEMIEIGKRLSFLRDQGVLSLGSGNIVHNLRLVDFNQVDEVNFAKSFGDLVKQDVLNRNWDSLIEYTGRVDSSLAIPTKDHSFPFLVILGVSCLADRCVVMNEGFELGFISMTSYLFE